mmetsp:Transcript_13702/g.29263  ORF Transcript_13702/g.29263 Transcript_13702/m.29263 type:complete len:332 (-) Transcript_13702:48-1043(-)
MVSVGVLSAQLRALTESAEFSEAVTKEAMGETIPTSQKKLLKKINELEAALKAAEQTAMEQQHREAALRASAGRPVGEAPTIGPVKRQRPGDLNGQPRKRFFKKHSEVLGRLELPTDGRAFYSDKQDTKVHKALEGAAERLHELAVMIGLLDEAVPKVASAEMVELTADHQKARDLVVQVRDLIDDSKSVIVSQSSLLCVAGDVGWKAAPGVIGDDLGLPADQEKRLVKAKKKQEAQGGTSDAQYGSLSDSGGSGRGPHSGGRGSMGGRGGQQGGWQSMAPGSPYMPQMMGFVPPGVGGYYPFQQPGAQQGYQFAQSAHYGRGGGRFNQRG